MSLQACFRHSLFALALLGASASALAAGSGLKPASPQPDAAAMKPGLAVTYYFNFYRHIEELEDYMTRDKGKVGKPLPRLNYRVGTKNVLTSEYDNGVGADINGLIHFAEPGTYKFSAQTNDGFRMKIDGKQILFDPDVHADRYTDIVPVQISEAGWYPLSILYYERKNTSTLQLFWLRPGESGSLSLVPGEVLAHLPK